ncbi:MAG: peptidase M28, partial [Spirosomataceae bacterium]
MKKFVLLCLFAFIATINNAQKYRKVPESKFTVSQANAHLQFLASDALLGRKTGEQGNLIAARYIAEQFRKFGVKPVNDDSYFQEVPFERTAPSSLGTISTDADTLNVGEDFVVMSGGGVGLANNAVIHVGYGWVDEEKNYDDYKDIDVQDKVVIAQVGTPDSKTPQEVFSAMAAKRKFAAERGAAAFIEIYNLQIPWKTVVNFFGKPSLRLKETEVKNSDILHLWVNFEPGKALAKNKITELNLNVGEKQSEKVVSQNVVGVIEGTDPN